MLRRSKAFMVLIFVGLLSGVSSIAYADDLSGHGYSREHVVNISDLIKFGGTDAEDAEEPSGSGSGSSEVLDLCVYQPLSPQPDSEDPVWGGRDPAAGMMWQSWCPDSVALGSWDDNGLNTVVGFVGGDPYYVGEGGDPGEGRAAVDPMVLVVQARAAVTMPKPVPTFGPSPGELAVKVPVWFAVPEYEPQVASATAGRFSATVTAELTSTRWDPGEPVDAFDRWSAPAPAVVCDGPGAVYRAGMDRSAPPCSYTYRWRSLPERTGGLGRWTLTVTSNYTVSFVVTDTTSGQTVRSGEDTEQVTTRALMPIREWHSVLGTGASPAMDNEQIYPEILSD